MRTSFIISVTVAALVSLNADARQPAGNSTTSAGTNLLTALPGIVNAIPGASNWMQSNLPSGASSFLHNLTNQSGTNHLSSPSNLFPGLSNWLSTNAAGGTNSISHVSNWFGTNVSPNGTNTFQEFTNWLGTNYSRTVTNRFQTNLTQGLSHAIQTNLHASLTNDSRLKPGILSIPVSIRMDTLISLDPTPPRSVPRRGIPGRSNFKTTGPSRANPTRLNHRHSAPRAPNSALAQP
jgi:hypothetical protein